MKKTRLFIEAAIKAKSIIEINDNDFNYLIKVMRKTMGDEILVFNGIDGEWLAKIIQINKKNCQIQIETKTKEQNFCPKIILAFAPVKNVRIDFIAAKATELGVAKFLPIITRHTIVDKINLERFRANIKEAAEQCERLDLPTISQPIKLDSFLKNLSIKFQEESLKNYEEKILILCDESGNGGKASEILAKINDQTNYKDREIIIFIGPEGGFSMQEFEKFNQVQNLYKISLGPRILRADTAMISVLTLVQEFLGDFN